MLKKVENFHWVRDDFIHVYKYKVLAWEPSFARKLQVNPQLKNPALFGN